MADHTHLMALQTRLSNEKDYLAASKNKGERQLRAIWIAQIEREITAEMAHLGMDSETLELSDSELLRELEA